MKVLKNAITILLLTALCLTGVSSYSGHVSKENKRIFLEIEKNRDAIELIAKFEIELDKKLALLSADKLSKLEFERQLRYMISDIDRYIEKYAKYRDTKYAVLEGKFQKIKENYEIVLQYLRAADRKSPAAIDIKFLYEKTLYPSVRIATYAKTRIRDYMAEAKEADKPTDPKEKKKQPEKKYKWVKRLVSTGSGTIIYSKIEDGKTSTYILTCAHIYDFVADEQKRAEKDRKLIFIKFEVHIFDYKGRFVKKEAAPVVYTHSSYGKDIMFIKLKDNKTLFKTARFIPKKDIVKLQIFTPVLNVGAGLGKRPYPSIGIITALYSEGTRKFLWQTSTPGIYGNSGGALFTMGEYEQIGIVVRMGVSGWNPITHQIFFVSPTAIWTWAESQNLDYLLK